MTDTVKRIMHIQASRSRWAASAALCGQKLGLLDSEGNSCSYFGESRDKAIVDHRVTTVRAADCDACFDKRAGLKRGRKNAKKAEAARQAELAAIEAAKTPEQKAQERHAALASHSAHNLQWKSERLVSVLETMATRLQQRAKDIEYQISRFQRYLDNAEETETARQVIGDLSSLFSSLNFRSAIDAENDYNAAARQFKQLNVSAIDSNKS